MALLVLRRVGFVCRVKTKCAICAAGVTAYTAPYGFACCCVFSKQSLSTILCHPFELQPRGPSPPGFCDLQMLCFARKLTNEGVPSPEVTAPTCRVP